MFQTVWKVSVQSGGFSDNLDIFLRVLKVSGQSGRFPDSVKSFPPCVPWYTWHVCKSDLCTFGTFMSQNQFCALLAHFCREHDLRALSGKFSHVIFCRPESLTFCVPGVPPHKKITIKSYMQAEQRQANKTKSFPELTTDVTTSTRWEAQETFYQGNQQLSPTASQGRPPKRRECLFRGIALFTSPPPPFTDNFYLFSDIQMPTIKKIQFNIQLKNKITLFIQK